MTRNNRLVIALLGLAAVAGLGCFLLRPRQPGPPPVPSLLGRPLHFDAAQVERAWTRIAADGELAKIFSRERLNRHFPDAALHCRVRHQEASHQALLAPGGGRIELELDARAGDRLVFAPFLPGTGSLTFRVQAGPRGRERLLYSGRGSRQVGSFEEVLLLPAGKRRLRLVLETRGDGVGAWVDPCLLRARPKPRTVLIIVLDTLRADHVSAYGYPRRTTPALDELARSSLLFWRAFSHSSWTLPAHVSLFSGRDVLDHGVVSPESLIPADLPLLAEALQADGFVTLAQTGGGFVDAHYGFHRGFQCYASRSDDTFQRETAGLLRASFMEDAARFAGQDLFVFLHTYQMHAPYKAPDAYYRAFNPQLDISLQGVSDDLRTLGGPPSGLPGAAAAERRKLVDLYDASILYSDQELIKPVLAYLRSSGRFAEAMVVVLSDHGEEFFDHGEWEHGHTLYPELTRIPLVVKLPGQRRGQTRRELFAISDVAGLILAQYGLDAGTGGGRRAQKAPPVLELSLPVSPFHADLFGKVSFVGEEGQYIHSFLPASRAGDAVRADAAAPGDEWLTLAESPTTAAVPFTPAAAVNSRFKRMLADYIIRLKALKRLRGRIDPELLGKLKALGYLGD